MLVAAAVVRRERRCHKIEGAALLSAGYVVRYFHLHSSSRRIAGSGRHDLLLRRQPLYDQCRPHKFRDEYLRFALWLAAYVVLGLLLAIFVQSLGNWLLS
jgi:hypothetical protein